MGQQERAGLRGCPTVSYIPLKEGKGKSSWVLVLSHSMRLSPPSQDKAREEDGWERSGGGKIDLCFL